MTNQLQIPARILAHMIRQELVIQGDVDRSQRGIRPELWLNHEASIVQAILGTNNRGEPDHLAQAA